MSPSPKPGPYWVPRTDVFISETGQLIIELELSGLQNGDIQLTRKGRKLRIKGKRRNPALAAGRTVLVNEIPAGPFESVLEFPPGFNPARASSAYLNGLLRISLPPSKS